MRKIAKTKNHKWNGTFYCQKCGQYKRTASKFCYVEVKFPNIKTIICKKI